MNYKLFIKNSDNTFTDPITNDIFKLNEPKTYDNFIVDPNIAHFDIFKSISNDIKIKGYVSYDDLNANITFMDKLKNIPIVIMNVKTSNEISIMRYKISKTMTIKSYVNKTEEVDYMNLTHTINNGIYKNISNGKYIFDENGSFIRKEINKTFYKVFNYKPDFVKYKSITKEFLELKGDTFLAIAYQYEELCLNIASEFIYATSTEAINEDVYDKNIPYFVMKLECPDVCGIYHKDDINKKVKYFGDYALVLTPKKIDLNTHKINEKTKLPRQTPPKN